MEIDLAQPGIDLATLACTLRSKVCIIGGGIAGLVLAERLLALGCQSLVLLEAGGTAPTKGAPDVTPDPFGAELLGRPHGGTSQGRVRALGGCSLLWGGQLLALGEEASWPIPVAEMQSHVADGQAPASLTDLFAKHNSSIPKLLDALPGFMPRLSEFLPFSKRNYAQTLGKRIRASPAIQIVLNAHVSELLLSADGRRVVSAALRSMGEKPVQVEADEFVLAAGTVETCRLLLASRSVRPEGVGNAFGQVGLHFQDHLSLSAAVFTGKARSRMLAELRPWVFRKGGLRHTLYSMKLEPTRRLCSELGINPAMAHITIEEPEGTGVDRLRSFLRARQQRGLLPALRGGAGNLARAAMHVAHLAYEACVRRRRYVSPKAIVRLQLNAAQDTPSKSRVSLSSTLDRFGVPKAVVDWRITEAELATFRHLALYLRERLALAGIEAGVEWEPALFTKGEEADVRLLGQIDDARHAMGGACMGMNPRSSVVDPDLRVHGMANLSIASAAVFPDGNAQLPTWTLQALCRRLAARLHRQLTAE